MESCNSKGAKGTKCDFLVAKLSLIVYKWAETSHRDHCLVASHSKSERLGYSLQMPDDQSFFTLVVEVFSWLLLLWSFDLQLYSTMRKQETSRSFECFYWCSYVVHLNFTYRIHEGWMAVGPHQGVVKLWTKILPSCNWCQQSIMLIT